MTGLSMRIILVAAFLAVKAMEVAAQNYIETDSSTTTGLKVLFGSERDNNHFINVKTKWGSQRYTPQQLAGYGNLPDLAYVARTILVNGEERRVFLNKRVKGATALYSYSAYDFSAFYLESKRTGFIQLSKETYKATLAQHMDSCVSAAKKVNLARFRPSSLTRLVSQYNTCSSKPFPHWKLGIIAGYGKSSLSQGSNYLGDINSYGWKTDYPAYMFGLTGDFPINNSYFSIHADVLFSRNQFSSTMASGAEITDIVFNSSAIDIPVLLRYRFTVPQWRPFINAGVMATYNFNTKANVYTSTLDQDVITTSMGEAQIVSDKAWGISVGAGIEIDLFTRSSAFVEVRSAMVYGGTKSLQKDQLMILTGFTF